MTLAERIAKLKELDGKATPSEWDVSENDKEETILERGDDWIALLPHQGVTSIQERARHNAELIAYLRNNALDIIEELEAERDEWRERPQRDAAPKDWDVE